MYFKMAIAFYVSEYRSRKLMHKKAERKDNYESKGKNGVN